MHHMRNGYVQIIPRISTMDLGVYSSKEKALKVLDEIQNWIHYEADENGITYQMPQDVDIRI